MDVNYSSGDGTDSHRHYKSELFCDKDGLKEYEKLLEKRKKIHEKLCAKLGRKPGELLMNASDELKRVKEDKAVLEYTRIPQYFDPYRGNPAFWKLPRGLHEKTDSRCRKKDPIYFAVQTKEERNEIPGIEYVTTPDYILKEKDLLPRTRNLYDTWKTLKYQTEKSSQLDKQIRFIEPHKPQLENLIIVGRGFNGDEEPEQNTTDFGDESIMQQENRVQHEVVYSKPIYPCSILIRINDLIFSARNPCDQFRRIYMKFHHETTSNNMTTEPLVIENHGVKALTFHWERVKVIDIFSDLKKTSTPKVQFYFNRNSFRVIPEQRVEIPIMARTSVVGTFHELWNLTTQPEVPTCDSFTIYFICHGYTKNLYKKASAIKSKIGNKSVNTVIRETIRDVLGTLRYKTHPRINLTYTEEQVFEAINYDANLFKKHPKYIYDKIVVDKLKEFYKSVKSDEDPQEWNLSINTLKEVTRAKDLTMYVDKTLGKIKLAQHKRDEQEILRQNALELSMVPKEENSKKGKEKEKTKGSKTNKNDKSAKSSDKGKKDKGNKSKKEPEAEVILEPPFEIQIELTHYDELLNLLRQLEKPCIKKNVERMKYSQVYSTLCYYISRICEYAENVQHSFRYFPKRGTYSLRQERDYHFTRPMRLVYEEIDDTLTFGWHKVTIEKLHYKEKPRPETLSNIASDDIDAIHSTYCGVTADAGKQKSNDKKNKKNEKEARDKKDKGKKDGKKDTKGKGKGNDKEKSVPVKVNDQIAGFDPFLEEYVPKYEEQQQEILPPSSIHSVISFDLNAYHHNLFIIFYTQLCEAVDALMEICDQFMIDIASPSIVYEINKGEITKADLVANDYDQLLKKNVIYPPDEQNLGKNEDIQSFFVKGNVRPTKSETRVSSLWSILESYIPVPPTPPEISPPPEPIQPILEPFNKEGGAQTEENDENSTEREEESDEMSNEQETEINSSSTSFVFYANDEIDEEHEEQQTDLGGRNQDLTGEEARSNEKKHNQDRSDEKGKLQDTKIGSCPSETCPGPTKVKEEGSVPNMSPKGSRHIS